MAWVENESGKEAFLFAFLISDAVECLNDRPGGGKGIVPPLMPGTYLQTCTAAAMGEHVLRVEAVDCMILLAKLCSLTNKALATKYPIRMRGGANASNPTEMRHITDRFSASLCGCVANDNY